jgi:UDP-N-acetylmuramoyl-tripeptide--D-alanyl-D-alanine ligase
MSSIILLDNHSSTCKKYLETAKRLGIQTILITDKTLLRKSKYYNIAGSVIHISSINLREFRRILKEPRVVSSNIKAIIGFTEKHREIIYQLEQEYKINSCSTYPHLKFKQNEIEELVVGDKFLNSTEIIVEVFFGENTSTILGIINPHRESNDALASISGYELITNLSKNETKELNERIDIIGKKFKLINTFCKLVMKNIEGGWEVDIFPGADNNEINELISVGTKMDPVEQKILFLLGKKVDFTKAKPMPVYLQYLSVEKGGVLQKITGRYKTGRLPFVHCVQTSPKKGAIISCGCKLGFIITSGTTQEEARFHSKLGAIDIKFHLLCKEGSTVQLSGIKLDSELQNVSPLIVAVTGSAGKTTTKSMIASILRERLKIFESRNSYNTHVNTAEHSEVLKSSAYQAAVLEYGMAYFGNITKHCNAIQPSIGVITNIGSAHIGHFSGDVKKVAKAKSELIKGMDQNGVLFVNADNHNSSYLETKEFNGKILKVGIDKKSEYQAKNISYNKNGMSFEVNLDNRLATFSIPIFGRHNIYNALFAIAVSNHLGFSLQEINRGLKNFKNAKRRLEIKDLNDHVCLIDDCHSSNPEALKAAINVMEKISDFDNVAVLGSMAELGIYSKEAHCEIGKYINEKKVDYLFTIGSAAKEIFNCAIKWGFPNERAQHFKNKEQLIQKLQQLTGKVTILVKGSRKMNMKEITNFLEDNISE